MPERPGKSCNENSARYGRWCGRREGMKNMPLWGYSSVACALGLLARSIHGTHEGDVGINGSTRFLQEPDWPTSQNRTWEPAHATKENQRHFMGCIPVLADAGSQALPGNPLPSRLCLARRSLWHSAFPGRAWERGAQKRECTQQPVEKGSCLWRLDLSQAIRVPATGTRSFFNGLPGLGKFCDGRMQPPQWRRQLKKIQLWKR